MKCPVCKKHIITKPVGATLGAGQLTACPICGVVFCQQAVDKTMKGGKS